MSNSGSNKDKRFPDVYETLTNMTSIVTKSIKDTLYDLKKR